MSVEIGSPAPDFRLKGHDGAEYRLGDYRGRNVVLLFYPADFTGVCTKELSAFCDDLAGFNRLDAQVFGISVDGAWSHKAFAESLGLDYPLLADFHPKGEVAKKYGLYIEEYGISSRAVVVVDREGTIALFRRYEMSELPAAEPVLEVLREL